jgi:hypothetical protein
MRFSLLLWLITVKLKGAIKKNTSLQKMISIKNLMFVIKTQDNKRGKRYIFKNGSFTADDVLSEYDMALVWRDYATAFKTLISSDETALQRAINNWDVKLDGNTNLLTWFGTILNVTMGKWKRK